MGIELYKHNAIAYEKVTKMFETENRVCVVHPTGCGKSFISLKWLEENRNKRAIFLAPSVSILRQITKHIEDSGMSMRDFPFLKRYTYSKLSRMTSEEISKLNVDMIVLDEFHRCGANEWSKGIAELINNNSNAKILGFSATPIRYLDEHRDMAEELFHGNVASEISLEEAMVEGILPMPIYINAVYSFKDDIEHMQEKINKEKRETEKLQAQQYYNEHGNLAITPKENRKLYQWLNIQKKLYMNGEKLTEQQKKLLEIIGINQEQKAKKEIDTKVKSKKPSRNDIWNSMYKEAQEYFTQHGDLLVPRNKDYKQLANWIKGQRRKYKLENGLSEEQITCLESIGMVWDTIQYQWEEMYQQAKEYFEHYGSLSIPDERCIEYKKLRSWIQEQKLKYNSTTNTNLSEEQIERLEQIGIVWNVKQTSYDNMYQQAQEYFAQHGDLLVPRTEEYKQLANWIKGQRRKYKSKEGLSKEEVESLEAIGMVWDAKKYNWDTMYAQAKAYYEEHGNLSFPYKDERYKKVANWVRNNKSGYYGKGSCRLTAEKVKQLQEIGVIPYETMEHEESLEELEDKLQSLVERKKQSSQLVKDYEKLQEKLSQDKGVEK